ncbi:MAG TPA: glycogen/starch synthase, partial [Candidatus Omnitrophota bacterium]|nr:glycogen/starch synthase [Candidatus Omnitrophota bacterium]
NQKITYYTNLISVINQAMALEIPDYSNLRLIPIDPVPGHPEIYTVAQVRAYWNTDDGLYAVSRQDTIPENDKDMMGRLDRITLEDIPYWQDRLANPDATDAERAAIQRQIQSLNREYNYGHDIVLPEAYADEQYQLTQGASETGSQVKARKMAARLEEAALWDERASVLVDLMNLVVPNYEGLPIVPVDPVPGHPEVYTVDQVREYWNTNDHRPFATTIKGRFARIQDDIADQNNIINDANATEERKAFARRTIELLNRETAFGNAVLADVEKDVRFQLHQIDPELGRLETPAEVIARKRILFNTEKALWQDFVALYQEMIVALPRIDQEIARGLLEDARDYLRRTEADLRMAESQKRIADEGLTDLQTETNFLQQKIAELETEKQELLDYIAAHPEDVNNPIRSHRIEQIDIQLEMLRDNNPQGYLDYLRSQRQETEDYLQSVLDAYGFDAEGNPTKLIRFQDWFVKGVNGALDEISKRVGVNQSPSGEIIEDLLKINLANFSEFEFIDSKGAMDAKGKKEQAKAKLDASLIELTTRLNNLKTLRAQLREQIRQALVQSGAVKEQEIQIIVDKIENWLRLHINPPPVQVGDELIVFTEANEPIRISMNSASLTSLPEFQNWLARTVVNGKIRSTEDIRTLTREVAAIGLFDGRIDIGAGTNETNGAAQSHRFVVLNSLSNETIRHLTSLGYITMDTYQAKYDTTKVDDTAYDRITTHYLVLIDGLGVHEGNLYAGVAGIWQIGVDNDYNLRAIAGTLRYDVTKKLILKLEAGEARADGSIDYTATLKDPVTGWVSEDSYLIKAKDSFSTRRYTVEFNDKEAKGRPSIYVSFVHKEAGVDDMWGQEEYNYFETGLGYTLPHNIRIQAAAYLGDETPAGKVAVITSHLKGCYEIPYGEGEDRYSVGTDFNLWGMNTRLEYRNQGRGAEIVLGMRPQDSASRISPELGWNQQGIMGNVRYNLTGTPAKKDSTEAARPVVRIPAARVVANYEEFTTWLKRALNIYIPEGKKINDILPAILQRLQELNIPLTLEGDKIIYGLKAYLLSVLIQTGDISGIIWDRTTPVIITDNKEAVIAELRRIGLNENDFRFITFAEVSGKLFMSIGDVRKDGDKAALRVVGYTGIDGKPAVVEFNPQGVARLSALQQKAVYRLDFADGTPSRYYFAADQLPLAHITWETVALVNGQLAWNEDGTRLVRFEGKGKEDIDYIKVFVYSDGTREALVNAQGEALRTMAASSREEGFAGWIHTLDRTHNILVTPLSLSAVEQGYSKGGWNGHHIYGAEKNREGKYILRISGIIGLDGKDATFELNQRGKKIAAAIRSSRNLIISRNHKFFAYYLTPAEMMQAKEELTNDEILIQKVNVEGETTHRINLGAGEVERIDSATQSTIFKLNADGLFDSNLPVDLALKLQETALPNGTAVDVWKRVSIETKKTKRIYGIDRATGKEVMQFIRKTGLALPVGGTNPVIPAKADTTTVGALIEGARTQDAKAAERRFSLAKFFSDIFAPEAMAAPSTNPQAAQAGTRAPPLTFGVGVTASPGINISDRRQLAWNDAFVNLLCEKIKLLREQTGLPYIVIPTYYPVARGTDLTQSKTWLDKIYQAGGRLIIGIPNYDDRNISSFDVNYWGAPGSKDTFKQYVRAFKDHPAIIGWNIFNEYNNLAQGNPEWFGANNYNQAINNILAATEYVAKEIKKIDTKHAVYTVWSGIPTKAEVARVPSVDGWGINYYSIPRILDGSFFSDAAAIFGNKYFYFNETGVDSYDGAKQQNNESIQAQDAVKIFEAARIYAPKNFRYLVFMTAFDEPWKPRVEGRGLQRGDGVVEDFNGQAWGFFTKDGRPKAVVRSFTQAVAKATAQGGLAPQPATATVKPDTARQQPTVKPVPAPVVPQKQAAAAADSVAQIVLGEGVAEATEVESALEGVVIMDLDEKASILPQAVRDSLHYTGRETLKRIYYYNSNLEMFTVSGEPLTKDNLSDVVGYAIETENYIPGYQDKGWKIVEELSAKGELLAARAIKAGVEQAVITELPEGGYWMDIIERDAKGEETSITSYRAEKSGQEYRTIEEIATLIVLQEAELDSTLKELNAQVESLSDLSNYGLPNSFSDILSEVMSEAGSRKISVGKLIKKSDGTFIIFRVKGDDLSRVIAQKNPDGTWEFNLSWDKTGQPLSSIVRWHGMTTSYLSSSSETLRQLLESDDQILREFKKIFLKAQGKARDENHSIEIETIVQFLARYGLTDESPLIKVRLVSYDRVGEMNGNDAISFGKEDETIAELYLIPGDPAGRILFEKHYISGGYNVIVNMWNWHEAVNSPFGILPGAITLKMTRGEGLLNKIIARAEEAKLFDKKLVLDGHRGYLYRIINGGYKQNEFFTEGGQLYRQEFRKAYSPLARSFFNGQRFLYYELDYPFRKPVKVSKDAAGKDVIEECIRIQYKDGIETQTWRVNTGAKGNSWSPLSWLRLFHEKETEQRYYNAHGESTTAGAKTNLNLNRYLLLGIIIMLWPTALLAWSLFSGARWNRWTKERKSKKDESASGNAPLYDEDIEEVEHKLLNEKVLETTVQGRKYSSNKKEGETLKTDSSALFVKSLKRVRILILSGVHRFEGISKEDLGNPHELLDELTRYSKSVAEYLGRHYSKGLVKLLPTTKGAPKKVLIDTPYDEIGYPDEEIWDKLELYFFNIEHKLRRALKDGNRELFYEIIHSAGIDSGVFDIEHFRAFLAGEGCTLCDKEIPADVKTLISKLREQMKTKKQAEVEVTDEEYSLLADYLGSFNRERFHRTFGIGERSIPPYLIEAAKWLPFAAIHAVATAMIYHWSMASCLTALFASPVALYLLAAAVVVLVFNTVVQYKLMSRLSFQANNTFRITSILNLALSAGLIIFLSTTSPVPALCMLVFKTFAVTLLAMEGVVGLAFGRSLVGISFYRNFRPTIGAGRPRTVWMQIGKYAIAMTVGLVLSWFIMPWLYGHFVNGLIVRAILGMYTGLGLFVYLMEFGSWMLTGFLSTILYREEHGPIGKAAVKDEAVQAFIDRGDLIVINYVGHPLDSRNVRILGNIMDCFNTLVSNFSAEVETLLDEARAMLGNPNLSDAEAISYIKEAIATLIRKENICLSPRSEVVGVLGEEALKIFFENPEAEELVFRIDRKIDDGFKDSEKAGLTQKDDDKEKYIKKLWGKTKILYSLAQVEDPNVPAKWRIETKDEREKLLLRIGHEVRRHLIMTHTALWPFDTAINLMDMAAKLRREGLGKNVVLVPTPNQYGSWWAVDNGPNYEDLSELFEYISGGGKLYTTMDCNPATLKSGAMHGMFMLPHEIVKKMRILIIVDRNANSLDLDRWAFDVKRMISNPNIVIMPALRNTTNILMPIGNMSWLVEGGHGYAMLGWNDKIGTGWENMMRLMDQGEDGYLAALRDPNCPVMPLTKELQELFPYADYKEWYRFGLIGLGPHTPHQSEDFTDVLSQTHNMIALGMRPNFALATALAFKIRETYSTAELENAVPRWSWGLTQTFWSFIFQVINDFGPESIFERDSRRDVARFYVTMPMAIVGLFLIPIGILLDILPFTGIGLVFVIVGTLFNQVSTLNGLGAHMRAESGVPAFGGNKDSRKAMIRGILGAALGVVIGIKLFGGVALPVIIGLYCFFSFASFLGFSRWLSQRPRDILLFAHRVAFEALAQFRSYPGVGYIFATSGGGDHKNSNVLQRMNNSKNRDSLYRAERVLGFVLVIFNVIAFMIGLDLTNAVFLFISTFYAVSMIIGPFVCENKPGISSGEGIKSGALKGFLRGWVNALLSLVGLAMGLLAIYGLHIALAASASIAMTFVWLGVFALPLIIAFTMILHVLPDYAPLYAKLNKILKDQKISINNYVQLREFINKGLSELPGEKQREVKRTLAFKLNNLWVTEFIRSILSKFISMEKLYGLYKYGKGDNLTQEQIEKNKAKYAKLRRALWQISCFYIVGFAAFMFFAIVPLPDYFYMAIGSALVKVTIGEMFGMFGWIFAVVTATVLLGKLYGAYKLNKLNQRYINFVRAYESARDSLDFELRSTIEARKQQIRIFFHQEAYKYIEEALNELETMLNDAPDASISSTGDVSSEKHREVNELIAQAERVSIKDNPKVQEALEATRGLNMELPQELGSVDIFETLRSANIFWVKTEPRSPPLEGHAGARRNTIYLITSSVEEIPLQTLVDTLIEESFEMVSKQKILIQGRAWTEELAREAHILIKFRLEIGKDLISDRLNIMHATSEIAPFSQVGGLANVSEELPRAQARLGQEVSVCTILYDSINRKRFGITDTGIKIAIAIGGRIETASIWIGKFDGVTIYFLEHPLYSKKPYLGTDSADYELVKKVVEARLDREIPKHEQAVFLHMLSFEQAVFLAKGTLELVKHLGTNFDIIHLHDWQAALAAVLVKTHFNYKDEAVFEDAKVLYSIHNLAYQGVFNKFLLYVAGLDWSVFTIDGMEFYDDINLRKAGINYADAVIAVSPTYAREILTPEYGAGLDGLLIHNSHKLHGILNGLDYEVWRIVAEDSRYTLPEVLAAKANYKRMLQRELGLEESDETPIVAVIARLVEQKGADLIVEKFKEIMELGVQFVLIGSGNGEIRRAFEAIAQDPQYRGKVAIVFGVGSQLPVRQADDTIKTLDKLTHAGSDIFL